MEWTREHSVGNEMLDRQHQELFAIIRTLRGFLSMDAPDAGVGDILQRLKIYTSAHFVLEETMMAEAGFPGFPAHVKAHAALNTRLAQFANRFEAGDATVRRELYEFLVSDWLVAHILGADRGYIDCVRTRFGPRPAAQSQSVAGAPPA